MTSKEVRSTIEGRLRECGEDIPYFIYGEFLKLPGMMGVFQVKYNWFVYETDERAFPSISGPFDDADVVPACVRLMHLSQFFQDFAFSEIAKKTYIYAHYRSLEEAKESLQNGYFAT